MSILFSNPRVDIYYNLHKKILSVRHKGKVVGHCKTAFVKDVKFVVNKGGRERVLKQKRKNVHAYIRGNYIDGDHISNYLYGYDWIEIGYNPYKFGHFYNKSDSSPVYVADMVCIIGKSIYVLKR